MWEGTPEVVHALRSQQQVASLTSALAGLSVTQTLNNMKTKKDRVREFACVHTSLQGRGFEATGTLELLTGQTLREVATAPNKEEAKDMVARVLLAQLAQLGIHD